MWSKLFRNAVMAVSCAALIGTGFGGAAPSAYAAAPTNNPVAAKYGSTTYAWTDNIKWSTVKNILDYGGKGDGSTDNVSAFNNARDAAVAAGGGVVYFPAGTYRFSTGISLKNGVVIRGETPSVSDGKSSTYDPPSNLVFPKYNPSLSGSGTANSTAFKAITTASPNTDSNIGVVNVDINRAAVKLVADAASAANKNIVVFGIRQNNVAEPDQGVPDTSFQNGWQRWSYRFAANIKIEAYENVLIANNRLNDATTDNFDQPGYKVKDGSTVLTYSDGSRATFNYTNHYGIDLNRSKSGGYTPGATPSSEPSLFRKGNVIRDNWVFHTMRIAITASGDGLQIRNNVVKDQSGKVAWVDPSGKKQVQNSATLENRAIDWSGYNVVVDRNDFEVFRHKLKDTSYYSVDGEGILLQECCGGTLVNGVQITNNKGNAYIGIYKSKDIVNATVTGNTINFGSHMGGSLGAIYVSANTNGGSYKATNVKIESNTVNGDINLLADVSGGSGNTIKNNTDSNGGGKINHSCEAKASISGNSGFTVNACK